MSATTSSDKKIAFAVNLFGENKRTDLAIESFLKIKQKYPNIDLYNVQFVDEQIKGRYHADIPTLRVLKDSSKNYIKRPSKKTLPIMNELFTKLSELDNYDYFIFTNDDIIISDRYIKFILSTDYDCYPASRLAIKSINTLSDSIYNEHFQVAGFDTFCIRSKWWQQNKDKFSPYILGHPCWDVHYATLCMRYGSSTLCNKWPAPTFHIIHGDDSHQDSAERDHNFSLYWKPSKFDVDMWHNYLFTVLLRRPGVNYCTPHKNELELEQQYFNDEWFKQNYKSFN